MTIRFGTSPIAWSNDDLPELGGATPLETCLAEARAAGYAGIELGHKFPREAASLGAVLDRHGLALVSGWYSGHLLERPLEAELAAITPHAALLEAMGAAVLIYAETSFGVAGRRDVPLSRRPRLEDWQGFGRKLTALAEALAPRGLRLAYHHHMGTVVETATEIDQLIESTGSAVGLVLDTGHLAFAGADPAAVAARHRARIAHVHCKDIRPDILARARAEDWSFLDAVLAGVFTVPGDGGLDFAAVLRALGPYRGWLVVEAEQDPARAPPLAYARLGRRHLEQAALKAGLLISGRRRRAGPATRRHS
jgi:myo-inosose-2 dehydratase